MTSVRSAPIVPAVAGEPPNWDDDFAPTAPAADAFAALTDALSSLQEAFTASRPDAAEATRIAADLQAAAAALRRWEVSEDEQLAGRLWSRAGRGQVMAPALTIDEVNATSATGHVTIGRFHAGRYALNGGVTPLIFDEILSRLGNAGGRVWARTANLTIDYRAPAPLLVPLRVHAELIGQEGRKRRLRGTITDGDQLIAEAHGLWVQTRPEHNSPPRPRTERSGVAAKGPHR